MSTINLETLRQKVATAKLSLKCMINTEEFAMLGTGPAFLHFMVAADIIYKLADELEKTQKELA